MLPCLSVTGTLVHYEEVAVVYKQYMVLARNRRSEGDRLGIFEKKFQITADGAA